MSSSKTTADTKSADRSFHSSWAKDYRWLECGGATMPMFCKNCVSYSTKHGFASRRTNQFLDGCTTYQTSTLISHAKSQQHLEATNWCKTNKVCLLVCVPLTFVFLQCGVFIGQHEEEEKEKPDEVKPGTLPECFKRVDAAGHARLMRLFGTAYFIAHHRLPMSLFEDLCTLQSLNGLDMGSNYTNRMAAKRFIEFISQRVSESVATRIAAADFIGISADESTDRRKEQQEAVDVRIVEHGEAVDLLVGMPALDSAVRLFFLFALMVGI
jgi:hypothetical protein